MLKRYSWIIGIMVASLAGMIFLHGFFAYQDYGIKTYEFQQQANLSFEEAVASEKQARVDSFVMHFRSLFADTSKVEILAKYHEEDERIHYSIKDRGTDDSYTTFSYKNKGQLVNHLDAINPDSTLDRIMNSVRVSVEVGTIYYWTQIMGKKMNQYVDSVFYDEKQLRDFFQENLDKRGIGTSFQIKRLEQDSLKLNQVDEKDYQTESFSTEFTGRDPVRVAAIMEAPFLEILGRIKLTLLGALLNILLIGASFFILLKVIYKQRKFSQIKDDFIDNITHELQTPIATLMAANEGMSTYRALDDPEKSKRYLAISKMELQRLSSMVDNILMSSIHKRTSMVLEWERVDVQDIIQLCIVKNELKSDQQVQFELDFQEGPLELDTDKLHLQNILDNLIENAIKYNDAEIKLIKISSELKNGQVHITVTDNGNGIPEDQKAHIFEKFYRIPKDVGQKKGFGIGLYYIKTILQQLKGQISIESAEKRGTSFILSFPLNSHEV